MFKSKAIQISLVASLKKTKNQKTNKQTQKATCKAKGERSKYQVYSCFERSLHCFGSRLSLLITGSEHMMAVGQWDSSELTYR